MPAVLAGAGTSSLITLAVIAGGAMLLAARSSSFRCCSSASWDGFVSSGNFGAFNASGGSLYRAIGNQEARAMGFGVRSEVGRLRQATVHRPGLELSRLTPRNIGELLFDDVMWAKRAKEEHDVFAETLRERGVRVHYFGQLLAETLDVPEGRAFVLDRVCAPEMVGPALVQPLRELAEHLDRAQLAEYPVGGILKADLSPFAGQELELGHAAGRRLSAPSAAPPVPARQLLLDLRRGLGQPMANVGRQHHAAQVRHRGGHRAGQRTPPRLGKDKHSRHAPAN
jgi:hypothetical protein